MRHDGRGGWFRHRAVHACLAAGLALATASTGVVAGADLAFGDPNVAPTVHDPAQLRSTDPSPTWTFDSDALLTYECAVTASGTLPGSWTDCTSHTSLTAYTPATPLATDGGYVFLVREGAGAAEGASNEYVLDRVATGTATPDARYTSSTTPHWTIAPENGASYATCTLATDVNVSCDSDYTAPTLPQGDATLHVDFVDDLGNTGSVDSTITVDNTPPTVPVPVTTSASPTNVAPITWTFALDGDEQSVTCAVTSGGSTVDSGSCLSGAGATSGSYSYTPTADGTYGLTVTAEDQAKNVATGTTTGANTITWDTTAPAATILTGPSSAPTTTTSATWTLTTPGTTTTCVLSNGATSLSQDCQSGSVTYSGLTNGTWTLTVTSTDALGNQAVTTPKPTYVVDLVGPAAPTVSGPSGLSRTANPTYTVTPASDAVATECRRVGTATVGGADLTTAWGACTGTLTTPQDGTFHLEARSTDSLGNLGATGSSADYVYDATPPAAPDWSAVPGTSKTVPTYPFSLGNGDTATCTTLSGSTPVESLSSCGPGYTPTLSTDGTYTVTVVLSDAAGNTRTVSQPFTYDRVAPGAVTLSTTTSSPNKAPSVSWSIGSDGSALTCSISPAVPLSPATCTTSVTADFSAAADGTYTLTVVATDAAGNTTTATANHVVDKTAPLAPTVTAPASPGNADPAVWHFTQDPSETAQCRLVAGLTPGMWEACSNGTYSVPALADGTYSVDVTVTDPAGNTSALGHSDHDYTSDRTAPAAPVISGPSGPGNVRDVTWTWTGELVHADCRLDADGVAGTPFDCTGGSFSTTLNDGSYLFSVQLTDAAGNSSTLVTTATAYVLDTVRPITPSVAGPSGTGRTASVSWSFGAEPGALVECALVQDTVQGAWSTCGSPYARTLTADGTYQLAVRVTDAAGNVSLTGLSDTYLYDATAPSVPVVLAPASPSAQLSPTWTFTGDSAVTSECRVERGGLLVQDWAACTSPVTVDLTGQPDGSYVLLVRDTDAATNTSPSGEALPFVLDTQAPAAPVVSGPTGPSTDNQPVFTWTGEAGAASTCTLLLGGVVQGAGQACASPYRASLSGDGRWQLSVALTDLAGNTGSSSLSGAYVFDSTPPTAPVVTAPASPGRNTSPSWSAVFEAGTTTECRLAGTTVLFDWSACVLPLTTDLTGLADDDYTLSVRATDAAGQTGATGSATYALDTTAPAAPVFTTVPASPSRSRTAGFAFASEAGSTLTCRLTTGPKVIDADTLCASPLTVTLTGLADGAYSLSVFATDAAGNAGPRATQTYVLDTAAPAAPFLLTGPAAVTPDRTPTWTFSGEPGVTFGCRLVGNTTGVVADQTCTSPFAPPALATDDVYTLTVKATDAAGNVSAPMTNSFQLDGTAPVTPDVTGPQSPGRLTAPTWLVSAPSGTVQCRMVKNLVLVRDWTTCGPTFTMQLTDGDGVYVLGARVLTATGVASSEVLSRYVLDTTAPAAAVLTAPPSPGTARRLTWTITSADVGATAQCQVLGADNSVLKAFAPCSVSTAGSPYPLDLTGFADGTYTLVVRLSDLAGNVGPDAASSYVLDTGVPNTVLVTSPVSPGSQVSPRWSLVGDADASLECQLTGPGVVTGGFLPCTADPAVPGLGSFTADLTSATDGTFVLTVRSRDAAGNLGPEATGTYVLDRVAPLAASAPVPPPSPAREPTIAWTFSYETGATALCTLSSAVNPVVLSERVCTSPWTTDLAPFGDGDYRLSVRVVDAAKNSSPSVSGRYQLDRTPSAAPSIVGSPANVSPDTTPTWYIAKADPQDTLACQLVGLAGSTWAPCAATVTFDLAPATTGSYVLQVMELDPVGNPSLVTSSGTYRLDVTAPWTAEVLPPSPQRARGLTPVFTIVRQPEDTTTVRLICAVTRFDGGPASAAPCAFGQSTVDLNLAPTLSGDGDVLLTVRTVDGAGRTSPRASALYRFDNVPPATPTVLTLGSDHGFANTMTWTISSPEPTDTFTCTLTRQGVVVGTPGPCDTGLVETFSTFGQYVLTVRAVDLAGNVSLAPGQSSYTYLPPVPTPATPRGPTAGSDATPTWTFPVPTGYRAVCSLSGPGGVALLQDVDCRTGSFTPSLPTTEGGSYTLSVVLKDAFDNVGLPSKQTYRYTPAAQVGHISTPLPPGTPGTTGRPPVVRPVVPPAGPTGPETPTVVTVDPLPPRGIPSVIIDRPVTSVPGARTPFPRTPALEEVPALIGRAFAGLGQRPTIPLVLLSIVVGFLLLQSRIDRRDPKLAAAPVGAEPELEFGPVLRGLPTTAGGARP